MVVQERHLCLNLAEMKDVDKARFLDTPISHAGLFGYTVQGFFSCFEPLAGERRPPASLPDPKSSRKSTKQALTQATRRCWSLLFLRRRLLPPAPVFSFILFRRWSKGRYPLSQRKINFLFLRVLRSMGRQVCDALLPHSRPRPIFASSQESTVRGRCTSPRTSGQSRLGPREFGEDASERIRLQICGRKVGA